MNNFTKVYELHPRYKWTERYKWTDRQNEYYISNNGLLRRDNALLERRSKRMKKKLDKSVNFIMTKISKVGTCTKKYQISGYHEFKVIKNKLMKNEIERINQGWYYCCNECDNRPSFVNKKVPCVYVEITKK